MQEALANVLRHSGSLVVRIVLHRIDGWLQLEVSDEGKGHAREVLIQARDSRSGVGISGMRERVEELGGCFENRLQWRGGDVLVTIPVETGLYG